MNIFYVNGENVLDIMEGKMFMTKCNTKKGRFDFLNSLLL